MLNLRDFEDEIRRIVSDRRERGEFILRMAHELLQKDADGAAVLQKMRAHYTTACSLSKHMSLVRSHALDTLTMHTVHAEYAPTIAAFRAALSASSVSSETRAMGRKFLDSAFRVQYAMQRAHRSGKFSFSHASLDRAIEQIRILPPGFDAFHLGKANAQTCRRAATEKQLEKHETRLVVPNAAALLQGVQAYLAGVHSLPLADIVLPQLVCSLMLVSGRRLAEITNGRSVFSKNGGNAMSCMFEGQLKKRESVPVTSAKVASAASNNGEYHIDKSAYAIPLLVDSAVFMRAHAKLRKHQLYMTRAKLDVALVSDQQVSERYANAVNSYARENMGMRRSHDLRATYATMVFTAFQVPDAISFNRLAMGILGHENIMVSLQYAHIVLKNFDRFEGALGKLPVDVTKRAYGE